MQQALRSPVVGILGAGIAVSLLAVAAQVDAIEAQEPSQERADAIPRLADGRPDLNGVWSVMNTANYDIEPHPARAAMQLRQGPYNPVPARSVLALGAVGAVPEGSGVVVGNKVPYTEEARQKRDENRADWVNRDPEIKCYLPGIPRANYMPHPFQIVQNESSLFFAYSYAGAARPVPFEEEPTPSQIDSWMGTSSARWDGDTLVILVSGQNGEAWLDRSGNHYSRAATVTERWSLVADNLIDYQATIEDPVTFTEPWTMRMNLYRRRGDDAHLPQFKCVEFVEELMYGDQRKEPLD